MNPNMNEDLMWERLKDMQREMENSRLLAQSRPRPRNFGPGRWINQLLTRRAIENRPAASDVA